MKKFIKISQFLTKKDEQKNKDYQVMNVKYGISPRKITKKEDEQLND